jgi:hypothetical protein
MDDSRPIERRAHAEMSQKLEEAVIEAVAERRAFENDPNLWGMFRGSRNRELRKSSRERAGRRDGREHRGSQPS